MTDRRIAHLVLTGGPCAGKSSALAYLTEELTGRGWRVLTVPEAATLLITGGVGDIGVLAADDRATYLEVQRAIVGLQRDLRDRYHRLAEALGAERTVVLHDRGIADNAAYMTPAEYTDVLTGSGLVPAEVYEIYDAVIHLRSAAVARPGYDGSAYTRANNAARIEDADTAATIDDATLAGWSGHPHLCVVGSDGSFAAKLERTLAATVHALGDPQPVEVERKFLLAGPVDLSHPALASATPVHITQVYLPAVDGGEQRVRSRTLGGVSTYTHAVKHDVGDGSRLEVETPIGAETFTMLSRLRDPATSPVTKTRYVFVVGDQRFELDHVTSPVSAWLLEAELVTFDDPLEVPDFLPEAVEVTYDRTWRNRALASRG